ncbi:MAG: 2-hydroxyacyl-CoA dehydratase [Candidatus Magnetomorum sp.]|nr:2-hydroxyacyl-CoA dehydratase [Candidatus Magnetomorum sp.]
MKTHEKTSAGKELTQLMIKSYLGDFEKAQNGAFVVWIAIMVPAEIFSGFDTIVYSIPESHAAMNAGKGVGPLQCEKAENRGYSMDLCSYARIDMGSVFDQGKDSPVGGLPKPDLLISNNNNCSLLVKWFEVYQRELNIPHFIIDVPFCYASQSKKNLNYIVKQYWEMIRLIETMSGQTFHMEKVEEAVRWTGEALKHWKHFLSHANHRPSGITAFDTFVQMAPFLTMRGTKELADHYAFLAHDTQQRVEKKIFPVPEEKYRLFWDNIAPWHQLKNMSRRMASMNANIVGATYTSCIGAVEGTFQRYEYDDSDPLCSLARSMNSTVCPSGLTLRTRAMKDAIKDLGIDGVVFASNRSCKPYSLTQMDQAKMIATSMDVPTVMIDVDHADVRNYNEENVFIRIGALLEKVDEGRR